MREIMSAIILEHNNIVKYEYTGSCVISSWIYMKIKKAHGYAPYGAVCSSI